MSRTQRIETVENPAKKMLKWSSAEGCFTYWDKEKEKAIPVDAPFKFAVLESNYVSINGYDEANNTGIWSNEVKDANDVIVVKSGNDTIAEFKKSDWKNVKDRPELAPAKYTQILYIAADFGEGLEIARMMINKSALTGGVMKDKKTGVALPGQENDGWINFIKYLNKMGGGKNAIYDNYIEVVGSKSKKNGAVSFMIPEFSFSAMDSADAQQFNQMAIMVDDYFANRPALSMSQQEAVPATAEVDGEDERPDDF